VITVVDYGVGNIAALMNMLDHLGEAANVADGAEQIRQAERLLLPGVGSFDKAMTTLRARGLLEALDEAVLARRVPVLGVCLGMQLFARTSEEGREKGLGWVAADVRRLRVSTSGGLKIPHIGWTDVKPVGTPVLFDSRGGTERFYFVHSYHVVCDVRSDVSCVFEYDGEVCCAVSAGNIHGVQFHPEKSHRFGMRLLSRFARLPAPGA
jgi:imidazole glycerol-phosphate synthase subunit HisH